MSDGTKIQWTDATWNPTTGCTKVSPGCDNCYAETFAERWRGTPGHYFERGFDVQLRPDKLDLPLHWKKPRRVFVNSMSDLFHDAIPDEYIARVFAVMALAPQHTFQVLTKRHARMRALLSGSERWWGLLDMAIEEIADDEWIIHNRHVEPAGDPWPLRNVWLGVSVENQQWADIRIPALLDTPAAVRFLSCEPLLGPVNLDPWRNPGDLPDPSMPADSRLHWVIVGAESGRGARPMDEQWARVIKDQRVAAGVPFFLKQYATAAGRKIPTPELDGRTWTEFPGGR